MKTIESTKERLPISEAENVSKSFSSKSGLRALSRSKKYIQAVNTCSIKIYPGEFVGLVGESGCGKSTLGRLLLRLETPTDGNIFFNGKNITKLKGKALRKERQNMQIIFQDPSSSLNPRFTVENTIAEALSIHKATTNKLELKTHIAALMDMVGLPVSALGKFPGEFSSGEKQRISLARALAVEPKFLVADEPVTALDPASREQVLGLLETVNRELNVAFLLIAHDIDTIKRMCSKIAVMHLGKIVETATTKELFNAPKHPYTKALFASRLSAHPSSHDFKRYLLKGEPPSPLDPPSGCNFHERCMYTDIQCKKIVPMPRFLNEDHTVSCHFNFDGDKKIMPKEIEDTLSLKSSKS
ncbi:MAG: ABC transporter ATP-binding protein [Deltaproteobacteria bacterium]|nr:ABC transporter ATP-binding protein [Deltaproteobacteria bacterium]